MTYQYDVFFSYKRDPQSDDWHREVKDRLAFYLRLELARQNLSIFFDTANISTGVYWQEKLAEATRTSRCLIGIWSPLYFQSKWCFSEWKSFREREQRWKCNVVIAASYHDGKHFPTDARKKQIMDFSDYTSTMSGFWSTSRAVDFEPRLKKFAIDAAEIIRAAPEYDDSFPVSEASDQDLTPPPNIGRPGDV